jgi:hypothetical protein
MVQFENRFVSGHAFQACHNRSKRLPALAAAAQAAAEADSILTALAASLKRSPDTNPFSQTAPLTVLVVVQFENRFVSGHAFQACHNSLLAAWRHR